jgi:hypothetical protein
MQSAMQAAWRMYPPLLMSGERRADRLTKNEMKSSRKYPALAQELCGVREDGRSRLTCMRDQALAATHSFDTCASSLVPWTEVSLLKACTPVPIIWSPHLEVP